MAAGLLTPDPRLRELSDLGLILAGAKLNTYVAGTPSTPLASYSDEAGTTPNTNPVVASAGGLFGPIYLTLGVAYKLVLTDSLNNPIWSQDNVKVPAAGLSAPVLVTQGGTGIVIGTSGGVLFFSANTTIASSGLLTQHGVMLGGGAGAAPIATAVGATDQVLTGVTGADPVWASPATRMLDRQLTLQTVANSTTETAVYTFAVPANTLGTTRALDLLLLGDHIINNGAPDSVRVRVKFGATTIFDGTIASVNNGANRGAVQLWLRLQAMAATNVQRSMGTLQVGDSTQNNAAGLAGSLSGTNTYTMYGVHNAIAEDSTAIKNLVVTFQMGTANAAIDMRAHTVTTELR